MTDSVSTFESELNKEFTARDFVNLLKRIKKSFVKNVFKLVFIATVGASLGFIFAYRSIPNYNAQLKFVMRSDPNSLSSGISGLSSILGGGTGLSGTGSGLERIIELIGSDRILGNAILNEAEISGKRDLIINHYIELQAFRKKWEKDSSMKNVTYLPGVLFSELNFTQRKVIKSVIGSLVSNKGHRVVSKQFDKKSGVVTISVSHKSEDFSIELANSIYKELIEFYTDQSLAATSNNVQVLTRKADSIKYQLEITRKQYAKNTDQALGLLLQEDKVENKSLAFKENMLSLMYAEVQKNLETLKYVEESSMPSFSIIDQPYSPLNTDAKNKYTYAIGGFMLFFILGFLVLLSIDYYKSFIKVHL
jgi:uncharacterized protein involved in exopolysaccharide biosynthesis